MEYNERIKQYRKQKNLTQQQLADEIGVSRQSVVRWENGFTVPSMYYAQQLAHCFGVTVTELMTGEQEKLQKDSDGDISKKHKLCFARFCIAVAAIAIGYHLLRGLLATIRHSYVKYGDFFSRREMWIAFDALNYIFDCLVVVGFFAAAAIWVVRLVAWLNGTDDRYLRYRLYRLWNIGLAAWVCAILAAALALYGHITYLLTLCIAAMIAAVADYIFDCVFKKLYGKRMVVPRNKAVDILNLVFCIIGLATLIVFACCIVYVATAIQNTNDLEMLFSLLYFGFAAAGIVVLYIAARVALRIVIMRRSKDN